MRATQRYVPEATACLTLKIKKEKRQKDIHDAQLQTSLNKANNLNINYLKPCHMTMEDCN